MALALFAQLRTRAYTPLICWLSVEHSAVRLKACDTGPGIAPEERDRVFDPFYCCLGSEELGSGLGLSIVKVIAERYGAQIRFACTDERARTGLCVWVVFVRGEPSRED
ncbi:ATP-binding protein [Pseudomonas chlororaphis]|nr:ATP-binding protein [Pseudomonas chlororaphis]MCO7589454.1 ATP-binding protein [Pseudomonas chlororaphis]